MDTFLGLTQTAWTGITALLTGGLLIGALVTVLYVARQFGESRKASQEASRPYVIVTAEPSRTSQHFFDLVVRNIGQRPAHDVVINLNPPPIRADEPEGHEISKIKMFNQPVAMIAPGQEMRTYYDGHHSRQGKDLPSSHDVTLHYQDTSGHPYRDKGVVDLEATKGAMFTDIKTLHHVGRSLDEIRKILQGASVMARNGSVEVDAAIESRSEQQDRLDREATDARRRSDEIMALSKPSAATVDHPEAQNPGSQGKSLFTRIKQAVTRTS